MPIVPHIICDLNFVLKWYDDELLFLWFYFYRDFDEKLLHYREFIEVESPTNHTVYIKIRINTSCV